ncbi:MAG: hypothetical protein H6728_11655 [Myxococcales bacterium]|nr:hypothetical protein [Myxococcales bacterium]
MLNLYLITLIVGGALILVSVVLGGDTDSDVDAHADLDVHVDVDMDMDVDADVDVDAHVDLDHAGGSVEAEGSIASELWLPFFSLRFWIFFAAFFGLTGTLLSFLSNTNSLMTAILSGGVGFVSGFSMAWLVQFMQKREISSNITVDEFVGQSCEVLLPMGAGELGKIRVTIHESQIELTAQTDEEVPLERGDKAFIISYVGGVARIVRRFKELEEADRAPVRALPERQKEK